MLVLESKFFILIFQFVNEMFLEYWYWEEDIMGIVELKFFVLIF